jgi:hypothetical protein
MTRRRTLALDVLGELLASGAHDEDGIARELAVPAAALREWLERGVRIPLDRQLLLATFLIQRVPTLARHGHRLRDHVRAMAAYEARETKTHLTAPVSRCKPPSRPIDHGERGRAR